MQKYFMSNRVSFLLFMSNVRFVSDFTNLSENFVTTLIASAVTFMIKKSPVANTDILFRREFHLSLRAEFSCLPALYFFLNFLLSSLTLNLLELLGRVPSSPYSSVPCFVTCRHDQALVEPLRISLTLLTEALEFNFLLLL